MKIHKYKCNLKNRASGYFLRDAGNEDERHVFLMECDYYTKNDILFICDVNDFYGMIMVGFEI